MWIAYDRSNFIFTLLLAELLVCSKFKKRSFFWLRLACGGALLLVLSFFWTTGGEGMLGIASGAFKFLGLFLLSFALLLFCCKCDVWSILFAAAAGYCIQHIAYQAHSVVGILAGDLPQWGQAAALAACCAAAYAALYFLFVRKLKYRDGGVYINNMVMLWMAAIIIVIAVFVSFYGAVYSIDAGSGVLLAVVCLVGGWVLGSLKPLPFLPREPVSTASSQAEQPAPPSSAAAARTASQPSPRDPQKTECEKKMCNFLGNPALRMRKNGCWSSRVLQERIRFSVSS